MNIKDLTHQIEVVKSRFSIIGQSDTLLAAIGRAVMVAPIDLSVLVVGESGSGKEFFPKIIHNYGSRKHRKYIAVNCGAIPEGTIDSELFGHEKGAFTGAISSRKGYFEEADGGTIFLDEVAELPLTTQARLLRVLESGEFIKVGSSDVQKTDVRIVAATNVDLQKAVAAGRFRQDLYYRLSTVVIEVPNLHDRGEDIFLLARKFCSDFSERYMTEPITLSEDARQLMLSYNWPGNVRQLKNVMEQLSIFNAGTVVSRRDLMELLPLATSAGPLATIDPHSYAIEREMLWKMISALKEEVDALKRKVADNIMDTEHVDIDPTIRTDVRTLMKLPEPTDSTDAGQPTSTLEETERLSIIAALKRNNGNRRAAARELGISERTLYRKMHEYDLQ